jgi:hypothetical protein
MLVNARLIRLELGKRPDFLNLRTSLLAIAALTYSVGLSCRPIVSDIGYLQVDNNRPGAHYQGGDSLS